jgi:ubiquitin-like protein Pup
MPEQVRKENRRTITKEEAAEMQEEATVTQEQTTRERALGHIAVTDELLDEIDELLGTDFQAEQMVMGYVQKGGQ